MEVHSCEADKQEVYRLLFNHTSFIFTTGLNLENLKYFCAENQERLGKIDIRFNIDAIRKLPHNHSINYIVMTDYAQILVLPYLLRGQSQNIRILTTKSMLLSAQIYAREFWKKVKKVNQIVSQPSFQEESIIFDNYDIEFNQNFSDWVGIFSNKQLEECFQKCVALNYGEKYFSETGNILTPFPSGINIGSAVWHIEDIQTKETLLWVQGLSHHNWRACQQFRVDPIHKKIDHVIFTAGTLEVSSEQNQDQVHCKSFLDVLGQRLVRGHNTKIVLKNCLVICDIINFIAFKFKEKFKKVFITGLSVSKMITFINSYVQFLTPNHRNRIYEDPPVYPFQSFEDLKDRNMNEGATLEQISEFHRIPTKQLILRYTPYIHFESDFQAYLSEGENAMPESIVEPCVDIKKLSAWVGECQIHRIHCIVKKKGDISAFLSKLSHSICEKVQVSELGGFIQAKSVSQDIFMIAEGDISHRLGQFRKENGWLRVMPYMPRFRLIEIDWMQQLCQELKANGIEAQVSAQNKLETRKSVVEVRRNSIKIRGECERELRIMDKAFEKLSKIIKLQ